MRSSGARSLNAGLLVALALAVLPIPVQAQGPPGGFGGGFGMPSLVMDPAVQEDLALTEKQKTQIKKLQASLNQQRQELFQTAREEGTEPGEIMQAMGNLGRENTQAVTKLLDKTQKARLAQIELQREGMMALAKPEMATKLKLTPVQTKKVKTILDDMRQSFTKMMPGGFPGGPPPGGGDAAATPGKTASKTKRAPRPNGGNPDANGNGNDNNGGPPGGGFPGGMPDFNSDEFRASMEKMRENGEKIMKATNEKLAETLTPEQKESYDKMLGKPFDLSKLQFGPGRGPGGPGGPGGPPADDAAKVDGVMEETPKKEAPAKAQPKTKNRKTAN